MNLGRRASFPFPSAVLLFLPARQPERLLALPPWAPHSGTASEPSGPLVAGGGFKDRVNPICHVEAVPG